MTKIFSSRIIANIESQAISVSQFLHVSKSTPWKMQGKHRYRCSDRTRCHICTDGGVHRIFLQTIDAKSRQSKCIMFGRTNNW